MFSIYFYLFNINKYGFDAESTVKNFTSFADEVVCATLKEDEESCGILDELAKKYPSFKVIKSDTSLKSNRFDGQLKTEALNHCSQPLRIIADADERFLINQRETWLEMGEILIGVKEAADGLMIPVVDLWGDRTKIRKNVPIGQKFRMHKDTIKSRGVVPQAELGNGFFRTDISDSTEPLNAAGQLGKFAVVIRDGWLNPINTPILDKVKCPYVIHEGYLDFKAREKLNAEFWKKHWERRSNKEENVITDKQILEKEEVIEHNLKLD